MIESLTANNGQTPPPPLKIFQVAVGSNHFGAPLFFLESLEITSRWNTVCSIGFTNYDNTFRFNRIGLEQTSRDGENMSDMTLPFGKYKQGTENEKTMDEMPTDYLQWLANQEPESADAFEVPDKFKTEAKKILLERGEDI